MDDILTALRLSGGFHDDPGDPRSVDLLDHALQCAAILAAAYPDDPELVAAGLVHDLGLVLDPSDHADHGRSSAHFVAVVLGSRVAEIVRLHLDALRYLITTVPDYGNHLGRESHRSIEQSGGPLSAAEMSRFLSSGHVREALALSRADERARSTGMSDGDVERWAPLLDLVAAKAADVPRRAAS